MARTKESSLWTWLRDGAPADCVLERVENSVDVGTPDTFGCWQDVAFVIELKSVPRPARAPIFCELKPEQASFLRRWARAGGRAYVLVQVGQAHEARRYLVKAEDCLLLLKPIAESQLALIARNLPKDPPIAILKWARML